MASIENRSRFVVSVKNNDELTKYFPYNKLEAVMAYRDELRASAKKYKPRVDQLDESWLVRIRQTGHPKLEKTFSSEATAEAFVKKVEAERTQKIFIDYAKSFNATFAELLVRFRGHSASPVAGVCHGASCQRPPVLGRSAAGQIIQLIWRKGQPAPARSRRPCIGVRVDVGWAGA